MIGQIYNIQRFCTQDGEGIRTTVFLKGCPLSCVWCHNPESQSYKKDLFFNSEKCINCGYCISACKSKAHSFYNGVHILDRKKCISCGQCTIGCYAEALEVCGKNVDSSEIIADVIRDKEFYSRSGGGMTLSGGEPLYQADFAIELAHLAKEHKINVAVETSGFSSRFNILALAEYTDTFLFDIKLFDDEEHRKYTGISNKIIFENLSALYNYGAKIILRCPIIPDINLNEKHFENIVSLAKRMPNILGIELEPYHPLGINKCERLGIIPRYNNKIFLDKEELQEYVDMMCSNGCNVRII